MKHTERRRGQPVAGRTLSALLACWLGACGSESALGEADVGPAGPTPSAATPASAGSNSPQAPAIGTATGAAQPAAATPPVAGATPARADAAPDATPAAVSGSPAILPCAVSTVLSASCQNCHGATPIGGAPMALVTYADLMKPANTQPTKKVYELVKERMHDTQRPMPPIGELAAADITAIDNWLSAGVPTGPASDATCVNPTHPTDDVPDRGPTGRGHSVGRLTPTAEETCYDFKVHGGNVVDDSKFDVAPGEFYEQFYYKVPWPAGTVATAYATVADNAQVLHHWLLFSTNEAQPEALTSPRRCRL